MKKINLKLIFFFAATVGLLVFLHKSSVIAPLERGLQSLLNPVASRLHIFSGKINIFYQDQTVKGDLVSKIDALEGEVEKLTIENASLKRMEEENLKLRQYLNFFNDKESIKRVMANVAARDFFSNESSQQDLIIDRGRADGLYAGLAVVDEKGAMVGKISNVEERSARVSLLTNNRCNVAVTILDGKRTLGATSGNLGLTMNVDFVPQSAELEKGDILVSSGLESDVPAGLAVGRVISVDKGTNEIWQKVSAEPVVDFDKVFIVAVIIP
jgi:rod shape-determining protein MreC